MLEKKKWDNGLNIEEYKNTREVEETVSVDNEYTRIMNWGEGNRKRTIVAV